MRMFKEINGKFLEASLTRDGWVVHLDGHEELEREFTMILESFRQRVLSELGPSDGVPARIVLLGAAELFSCKVELDSDQGEILVH